MAGFVNTEIVKKVSAGGTQYGPVMQDIIDDSAPQSKSSAGSLLTSLFGKQTKSEKRDPTLAIFITDGENSDRTSAKTIFKESLNKDIYWVLIGIGHSDFSYIQNIGDDFPNATFLPIDDIKSIDDEDLYDGIICEEFAQWVSKFK
jgi:hypothetical protein